MFLSPEFFDHLSFWGINRSQSAITSLYKLYSIMSRRQTFIKSALPPPSIHPSPIPLTVTDFIAQNALKVKPHLETPVWALLETPFPNSFSLKSDLYPAGHQFLKNCDSEVLPCNLFSWRWFVENRGIWRCRLHRSEAGYENLRLPVCKQCWWQFPEPH